MRAAGEGDGLFMSQDIGISWIQQYQLMQAHGFHRAGRGADIAWPTGFHEHKPDTVQPVHATRDG